MSRREALKALIAPILDPFRWSDHYGSSLQGTGEILKAGNHIRVERALHQIGLKLFVFREETEHIEAGSRIKAKARFVKEVEAGLSSSLLLF